MVGIFGIVNVTRDSFSDGGRWLAAPDAIGRAERLLADGAEVIDVGAESTHPDAEDVPAAVEIERLAPVVDALCARGVAVSVDTRKPPVMQAMVARGVRWLNDVNGFRSAAAMAVVAAAPAAVRFVAMFARTASGRADRAGAPPGDVIAEITAFFRERVAAFGALGIARERLVLDPGMGFFVGPDAAASLRVLAHVERWHAEFAPLLDPGIGFGKAPKHNLELLARMATFTQLGRPLLLGVSRKSFLGAVTGAAVGERSAATLAAELHLADAGVAWVRTHDVKALRDALAVRDAIRAAQ